MYKNYINSRKVMDPYFLKNALLLCHLVFYYVNTYFS